MKRETANTIDVINSLDQENSTPGIILNRGLKNSRKEPKVPKIFPNGLVLINSAHFAFRNSDLVCSSAMILLVSIAVSTAPCAVSARESSAFIEDIVWKIPKINNYIKIKFTMLFFILFS